MSPWSSPPDPGAWTGLPDHDLRRLAAETGPHASDVFLIADRRPPDDLAALTGTPPPERPPRTRPATPGTIDFLWTTRSVSPTDDESPERLLCHCSLYRGPRR